MFRKSLTVKSLAVNSLAVVALATLAAAPAFARMKAPDAMMHFKAIAGGDIPAILSQYAPGANFEWIGGPLNGDYRSPEAIKDVWQKFTHANGPMKLKVTQVRVASDPGGKGMTVSACVDFIGKKQVHVRYVLAYRDAKIVDEIWQIHKPAPMKGMKQGMKGQGAGQGMGAGSGMKPSN